MLCPTHHRAVHEGGWNVDAEPHGTLAFIDPRGNPVPEVVVPPPPCTPSDAISGNEHAGIAVTPESIRSLSEGEPMDLDWTMMAICCAHPPVAPPRDTPEPDTASENIERSAERSAKFLTPTQPRRMPHRWALF